MTTTETPAQTHIRLARELLDQADQQLMSGEKLKASANLWEAVAHTMTVVCESRGWPHGDITVDIAAVDRLGEELGITSMGLVYILAQDCGANATYDFMKFREIRYCSEEIRSMVEKFLAM